MVNFTTRVVLRRAGEADQRAEVLTHELFGAPAEFIGYVAGSDVPLVRKVVAVMRRRGVKGRCAKISAEEAAQYYPQPYPLSLILTREVRG